MERNRVQAILFDFDGVILESVNVKGWAFGKLFEKYPQHVEQIIAYHHANGGMSRFDKFRYIYQQILKESLSEEQFQQLCDDFEKLVYTRVLECEFVPGALEFLGSYYQKIPLFVVSATPHEEIKKIVQERGIGKFFKDVCGSPTTKEVWIKKILKEWSLEPDSVVYVGDSVSDYQSSKGQKVIFIGRILNRTNNPFSDKRIKKTIINLGELESLIEAI